MKCFELISNFNLIKFIFLIDLFVFLNIDVFDNQNTNEIKADISNSLEQHKSSFKTIDISIGKEYLFSQNNFKQIREISNCCDVNFDNNIGRAFSVNLGTRIQVANVESLAPIDFILNLGYSSNQMTFRRFQPILLGLEENLIDGEFEHKVVFDFNFYSLNIAGEINLYQDLYYRLGFDLAKVGVYNYSQIEQITKPNDSGVFVNNTSNPANDNKRTRNEIQTTFQNENLFFIITNDLIYKLPSKFDKVNTYINIGYKYITNQMLENLEWKMNKLNTSIILSYEL